MGCRIVGPGTRYRCRVVREPVHTYKGEAPPGSSIGPFPMFQSTSRAWPTLLAFALPFKAVAAAALIAPLAFLMGMPFPMGLARLSETAPAFVPWAWGINGCASVLSPILATLLSIHWGFDGVIALAVGLYFIAAAVWRAD